MASPEMFLTSPSKHRIATSPLVISSSPDFPSLQNLGSQPLNQPIFKSTAPTTPRRGRSQTSAPGPWRETMNLSPTLEASVHESHYRTPSKAESHQSIANKKSMIQRHDNQDTSRQPLLLSSSPAALPHAAATESKNFKKPVLESLETEKADTITNSVCQDAPLNLERAPARRLDWTPPKQKSPKATEPENLSPTMSQLDPEATERSGALSKVLEAFKCDNVSTSTTIAQSDEDGSIFRKRKLIDAVSTNSEQSHSVAAKPLNTKKKPAPKKKPRTITGLATAAYKLASQPDPGTDEETRTRSSKAQASDAAADTENNAPKNTARKRTTKAPQKRKKKEAPPKRMLLSPSAALRQVANQDFLFGTSSQLAQEQSPRFLRDLATAMKNSNETDYITLSTPINSDAIEPPEAKRSLWDAAARDEAGDLFDLGIQELAQTSQDLPVPQAEADPFGYFKEASPPEDDSFLTLSDALKPPKSPKLPRASPPAAEQRIALSSPDTQLTPAAPISPDLPSRPRFELFTDAQLASAVSSYGFKNIRQRGARIALLEKCWQGKNQTGAVSGARSASTLAGPSVRSPGKSGRARSPVKTPARPESSLASASQPQEPPPSAQQPMSPPKRPRGRPRNSPAPTPSLTETVARCAAAVLHPGSTILAPSTPKRKARSSKVVEIPDSESDADELETLSDSPSSVPDETFSPSQAVDLSLSMDDDAELSMAVLACDKPASFEYITKAVTSAPRCKDVNNPSWYEKILMYDPIILEDLTAWLNCGPLTTAGYDDEVSSGEVKKWCESKSICCLWKVNLRGKERKRY